MKLNYLEDCWPCANGLSVVNVIGTMLHDPINSGLLTRWRMAVQVNGRRRGNLEESRK